MSTESTPQFKGESLFDSPQFCQLKYDDFGEHIVKRVNEQYKGTCAEIPIPEKNAPITHSNIFRLFAIDSVARSLDARVMLPEESELLLFQKRLPEQGKVYYDLGACLDFSNNNHDLAVLLYEQIPKRSLDSIPAVLLGLQLKSSDKGDYGLEFVYGVNSQLRHSPILAEPSGNFDVNDSELLKIGLPSKLGKGDRKLYTTENKILSVDNLGLSRLFLDWDLVLNSSYEHLAYSYPYGRVVVVTSEAGAKNFEAYLAKRVQARQKYLDKFDAELKGR